MRRKFDPAPPASRNSAPSAMDPTAAALRLRAEELLQTQPPPGEAQQSALAARQLVDELRVHQIELELQNAELQAARGEVEAALARYTDLYDFAPVGYFTLRRFGEITQTNLAGARLLGVERARLTGRHFGEFVSAADLPVFNDFLLRVCIGEVTQSCEVALAPQGQPPRTLQIGATLAADGQECRLVVVDITERKMAEQVLSESESKYRLLADFATDCIFWTGPDRHLRYVSPAIQEMTGYAPRDFLADPGLLERLIHPDDSATYLAHFFDDHGTDPHELEFRLIHRDGSERWIAHHCQPLFDAAGTDLGRRGSNRDITVRKSAEEQLQLAALVYQALGEAIMVCDTDNRIVAINPAFTATTGYSAAEALGQTPALLKSGRHPAAFYQAMWQSLNTTGRWQGEILNRKKNGEIYNEWLTISTIYYADSLPQRRVAMFSDITEQKRAEATIWRQANYDPLTGLPNRNLFRDRLEQEIKGLRGQQNPLALLFIDLDNFKEINDTLGHDHGDLLLVEAARRIGGCMREGDTVARLGGDEFTVILPGLDDAPRIEQVAQMILQEVARRYELGAEIGHISASIGITLFPADATDSESLLKHADQAMFQSKALGRNRYSYFTATMQQVAQDRLQLSNELRGALAAGQLMVYYQPIIRLATLRCVKAEALLRWRHPLRGMVGPAEFIPLAEQIGLIGEIGHWVFCQAAGQVKQWRDLGTACVQVSVNKSPRQFFDVADHHDWFEPLRALDLPAASINIEITEGLLLDARASVKESLSRFHAAGMQISLDDFGTGYSALSYLKKFPIDYLKIDQSFVRDMVSDPTDQAIVEAIIVMAHKLGMQVVAEGVETIEQRDLLVAAGCDYAQGYLFARPLPQDEFVTYLENDMKACRP